VDAMKIGVSACLLGDSVTWKGSHNESLILKELLKDHEIIKVCPEVLAGLSIPRNPSEIISFQPLIIKDNKNNDVSNEFKNGALYALDQLNDIDFVILKANSPSCGNQQVYDGTFSHRLVEGKGVFADLLFKKGIIVFNENQIDEIKKCLEKG
jgi:Uncharacterized conserved protein